ncbi:hypothetical protein SNEBB_007653 [Seison nebaliae]|nr:hypothetical protein SNEBB_007653 [Seison nebaliae]
MSNFQFKSLNRRLDQLGEKPDVTDKDITLIFPKHKTNSSVRDGELEFVLNREKEFLPMNKSNEMCVEKNEGTATNANKMSINFSENGIINKLISNCPNLHKSQQNYKTINFDSAIPNMTFNNSNRVRMLDYYPKVNDELAQPIAQPNLFISNIMKKSNTQNNISQINKLKQQQRYFDPNQNGQQNQNHNESKFKESFQNENGSSTLLRTQNKQIMNLQSKTTIEQSSTTKPILLGCSTKTTDVLTMAIDNIPKLKESSQFPSVPVTLNGQEKHHIKNKPPIQQRRKMSIISSEFEPKLSKLSLCRTSMLHDSFIRKEKTSSERTVNDSIIYVDSVKDSSAPDKVTNQNNSQPL